MYGIHGTEDQTYISFKRQDHLSYKTMLKLLPGWSEYTDHGMEMAQSEY